MLSGIGSVETWEKLTMLKLMMMLMMMMMNMNW